MNYILSKFSHELRNPLTSLSSTIQLLELKHPEVKDFKYWPNLGADIDYMISLLDQFSDLSKSEQLQISTFSLRAMLEQVSLSFAAMIMHSEIHYTSKIDSSIHQITGDKTKLQEVFLNLLKNAFEAASPGDDIYLEAIKSDNRIVFKIRDTGCGIPEDQLSTIFEPFVTYKPHGTGLGLAICRQIVNAHGGDITVKSVLNKGTMFTITLPLDL